MSLICGDDNACAAPGSACGNGGTRVATFHWLEGKIPPGYALVEEQSAGLLKFWVKIV